MVLRKTTSNKNFIEICLYILLFCAMLNVGGRYSACILLMFSLIILRIVKWTTFVASGFDFCFIIFMLTYVILSSICSDENELRPAIQYVMLYVMGRSIVTSYQDGENYEAYLKLLLIGASGVSLYATISTFTSDVTLTGRLQDIWNNQYLAETQLAAWEVMFLSLFPWLVLSKEHLKKTQKVLAYFIMVFAAVSVFMLSSRTGLIILVLAIGIGLWSLIKDKRKKGVFEYIVSIVGVVCAYVKDWFGLQTMVLNSNLIQRLLLKKGGERFSTSRFGKYEYVFDNFFSHMWGGYHFREATQGQIHNIFFDLYDEASILALLIFVVLAGMAIGRIVAVCRDKKTEASFRVGIACWFIINCLQISVEPVWDYGYCGYLAFFFCSLGGLESIYLMQKRNRKSINRGKYE